MAGLTSTGFEGKTAETIATELGDDARAAIDPTLDTSGESAIGQLFALIATQLGSAWELAQAVYAARDPGAASAASLDRLAALTGTTRSPGTYGTVTLSVGLGAGTTLPAGSVAHVAGQTGNRWVTTEDVTNSGGSPATLTVAARAESVGATPAYAGTISVIATPVSGWTSVSNSSDATVGSPAETDPALRLRRERELQGAASSPVDALRTALSRVSGVTQVTVWENATDGTVGGLPPHSVEAMVVGGTDLAVAAALWAGKAGGIATHGTTSADVTDASGTVRTLRFTRPTELSVYAEVRVRVDRTRYVGAPGSGGAGDVALKASVAALTASQLAGAPVQLANISCAALNVAGVVNIISVRLGLTSGTVTASDLVAGARQRALLDTSRITVVAG